MKTPEFGGERSAKQDEVWSNFYAKANEEPRPLAPQGPETLRRGSRPAPWPSTAAVETVATACSS